MQAQGMGANGARGNGRANGPPAGMGGTGGMGGAPAMGRRGRGGGPPAKPGSLMRAIRYVGHYRRLALLAYTALFLATAAQLVVPQLLQNIIDEVVKAFIATQVLALPAAVQALAAQKLGQTV